MEIVEIIENPDNGKRALGTALLAIGTGFAIWSATNTSPTGMEGFGCEHEDIARQGMLVGAGLVGVTALGTAIVFKEEGYPAAVALGLLGGALWLWYDHILKQCPGGG